MSKKQSAFIDVASEYFDKYDILPKSSFEGIAEKLNSRFTVLIIAVALAMMAPNNYFDSKIACYLPTVPNMKASFVDMFHEYCFVNGTILLLPEEKVPSNEYEWTRISESRKISFYQWIPLVLLLQMMLFLVPSYIWSCISNYVTDTDFDKVLKKASNIRNELDEENRSKSINIVAKEVKEILRQNKFGTKKLRIAYLSVKIFYLINVLGQLSMMFLFLFQSQLLPSMTMHVNEEQGTFLAFPRKVFCNMPDVIGVMGNSGYSGQCILYMNLFHHVIYIFLYYWFMAVSLITLLSIVTFCIRSFRFDIHFNLIRHLLTMSKCFQKSEKEKVKAFIKDYLKGDGVFLIRMLENNVKSFICGDVLGKLYEDFEDSL